MAIVREEALALLSEMKGSRGAAIKHRQREIKLMQRLHEDLRSGGYEELTKASILVGRDESALQERRAILHALKNGQSD
jgi:hypothetical protein